MGFFYAISWYVGAGMLSVQTGRVSMWLYKQYLKSPTSLSSRYGYGSWAVINGAPGYYAHHLAAQKFNIVFITDDVDKAQVTANEVKTSHQVETAVVKANFLSTKAEDYQKLLEQISDKDVSILVNNTAKGSLENLMTLDLPDIQKSLTTAMMPTLLVTYYAVPMFLKRDKLSAIVNHGKQDLEFNEYFSTTLGIEYKNKIDLMSVRDEGDDPEIGKKALENLGQFGQTFSNKKSELMELLKLNRIKEVFERF